MEDTGVARLREVAIKAFDDPEQADDRKCEGAPVDEPAGTLMSEDGKERPGDGDGSGEITLGCGEGVRGCGRLEEEEAEEDEDLGPDARVVGECVDAEGLEK